MSEENKQQNPSVQKGGAHVAKAGSNVSVSAEKSVSEAPETEKEAPKRNKYADKMNKNKKKSKLGKRVRIAIGVLIVALLVGLGIFLVMRSRDAGKQDTANQTAVVMRGMLETYIEGDGVTAAKKREELGKELKGKVSDIAVQVGDEVKKGDKLLVVNPTETRKELSEAEEELSDAQRGVSDAQALVTKAQNEVNAAQKRLGKLTITAPFSGKIVPEVDSDGVAGSFRVGQQIGEGQVIGNMVDDSTMKLSLYFSTAYSGDIKTGQTATVSIPSAMSSLSGTVSSIEQAQKVSDEGVKLFRVVVSVKNPGTLTKGMLATATVTTSSAGEVYPAESGTLEYNREEAVTAQVSGEITAMNGIDYYNYNSGATIMRLTSDTEQDNLKTAQSGVVTARNGVTAAQKLVKTKQDRITELKKLIANATIKSPIDGVVVSLNAMEDQEVTGTDPLVVVADMNDIIVNANITATDVSAVQPGQTATMTMYTNDGEIMMTGVVDSVAMEPSQNNNSGQGSMPTFPAVIVIDPVEGQSVSIGQGVNFKITTASSMDCLIVPSAAIVNTEDGTAVFAKPAEGQTFDEALPLPEGTDVPPEYVLVPVEVGISDASNTEILWGIDEGTTVYLAIEDANANFGGMDGMSVAVG